MTRYLIALLLLSPLVVSAQEPLYRYLDKDGRVVYTDAAPPPDASSIQRKRLGGNFIETSEAPYAVQVAQQRNPITLYAGGCGLGCEAARALLNRRGVPFKEVDPGQPADAAKLKEVTGDMLVPVLLVGSAIMLKGFEESAWQSALDTAGYPKTPPPRVMTIRRDADKAAAEKVAGKPPAKK